MVSLKDLETERNLLLRFISESASVPELQAARLKEVERLIEERTQPHDHGGWEDS